MRGYRIHFVASLAITTVFLICALSAVFASGPAAENAVSTTAKGSDISLATSARAATLEMTPLSEVDAAVSIWLFEPVPAAPHPVISRQPSHELPPEGPCD